MPAPWLGATMRKDLAAIVCCPVHKTRLDLQVLQEDSRGDIVKGTLSCPTCPFDYPIEEGVPNLLPPEYHVAQVKDRQPVPTRPASTERTGKGAKPKA